MTNTRNELHEMVNRLHDNQLDSATRAMNTLISTSSDPATTEPARDDLTDLLIAIVSGLNNSLYDLSAEADRNGAKVVAKRLDFSRKKIMEGWEIYNKKRQSR